MTNGNKLTLPFNSCVNILSGGILKKSTAGGGNSTALVINNDPLWNAGMGQQNGPISFCESVLPIELLQFEARTSSDKVDLIWATASEINNDQFIIERSTDGKLFEEILKVKGAGNSTELNEYTTTDFYPVNGISYYRLRQVDFDGKSSYSDIIGAYIKVKTPFDFISVETTINSTIKLTFTNRSNEMCNLKVLELSGAQVFNMDMSVNAGLNKKEIYCPFLKKGVYLLSISNDEQVLSKKISFIE